MGSGCSEVPLPHGGSRTLAGVGGVHVENATVSTGTRRRCPVGGCGDSDGQCTEPVVGDEITSGSAERASCPVKHEGLNRNLLKNKASNLQHLYLTATASSVKSRSTPSRRHAAAANRRPDLRTPRVCTTRQTAGESNQPQPPVCRSPQRRLTPPRPPRPTPPSPASSARPSRPA